eukprot:5188963-Pyramimonas_sp.AAC.1
MQDGSSDGTPACPKLEKCAGARAWWPRRKEDRGKLRWRSEGKGDGCRKGRATREEQRGGKAWRRRFGTAACKAVLPPLWPSS